ncbi:MAG TPA: Hsp70 family protein [Pseudonocardiaceae bacterium]
MSYSLGIDLGTTFTAAAVSRDGRTEIVPLGDHAAEMPSVVLLRQDGGVLAGSAADRRASTEPERVAREFKRRLGDPTPIMLGGAPHSAGSLLAHLLRAVVEKVTLVQGARPSAVTLTHPANWGLYKRELFDQVPLLAEIGQVTMVTEPEAAAAHYAAAERLPEGASVAIYDLGGGTFDATVLRKTAHGFDILGQPQGIEGLGGIDFDEAVFTHVRASLGDSTAALAGADHQSVVRLRQECVLAKEALSADTETTIPVLLPGAHTHVRLTRGEFEDMIRPAIGDTLVALRAALRSAAVDPEELTAVLLVGGSSRIPLVAKLVSGELGRPTAIDTHPKHVVALGAAAFSARDLSATRPDVPVADMASAAPMTGTAYGAATPAPAVVPIATAATQPLAPPPLAAAAVPPPPPPTAAAVGPASATFGAGSAPPSLDPKRSGVHQWLHSNRRSVVLAALVAVLLLGAWGVGTSVFGNTSRVGSTTGPPPPPQPVVSEIPAAPSEASTPEPLAPAPAPAVVPTPAYVPPNNSGSDGHHPNPTHRPSPSTSSSASTKPSTSAGPSSGTGTGTGTGTTGGGTAGGGITPH